MLVFSVLYIVQENYSDNLVDAVDPWNAAYGPLLHKIKITFVPLQASNVGPRFGAASFCCAGNYGMPQYLTNTMHICTKVYGTMPRSR
jgi:hypothetical protein